MFILVGAVHKVLFLLRNKFVNILPDNLNHVEPFDNAEQKVFHFDYLLSVSF